MNYGEKIRMREKSFVNCSRVQANSHRIIDRYIQNESAKQTEQNAVEFVTETKFSTEHRNKPGVLICMLHCGDFTSENKTSYQRRRPEMKLITAYKSVRFIGILRGRRRKETSTFCRHLLSSYCFLCWGCSCKIRA